MRISKNVREKTLNLFFVLPALSLFLIFSFYPLVRTFQLSFFEWDGIALQMKFVGFAQYLSILTKNPAFWRSMLNALYITVLALTFQNGLALLLALLVNREIRGDNVFRTIFFLPPVFVRYRGRPYMEMDI